jgi:hypothetical protein
MSDKTFDISLINVSESNTNYYKLYNKLCKVLNIDVFTINDQILLLTKLTYYKNNFNVNDPKKIYTRLKDNIIMDIENYHLNNNKLDILLACHEINMKGIRQIKIFKYGDTIYDIPSIDTFKKYNIKTLEYVDVNNEMTHNYNGWELIPHNSKNIIDLIHCSIYGAINDPRTGNFIDLANDIFTHSYNILKIGGFINVPFPPSFNEKKEEMKSNIEILLKNSNLSNFRTEIYEYTTDTTVFNTRIDQYNFSIRLYKNE